MSNDYPMKSTTKLIHQPNKSSRSNTSITIDYINAMQIEMNLSRSYRELNAWALTKLSEFQKNKPFNKITREDILSFLNSFRKTDSQDPLHKWIGTYNLIRLLLMRFFTIQS
jgi:integrase/recombinase XerD